MFEIEEIKSYLYVQDNLEKILDGFEDEKISKLGIIKDNNLVAIMLPIQKYESLMSHISQVKDPHILSQEEFENFSKK